MSPDTPEVVADRLLSRILCFITQPCMYARWADYCRIEADAYLRIAIHAAEHGWPHWEQDECFCTAIAYEMVSNILYNEHEERLRNGS